jgi:hypothetical protein
MHRIALFLALAALAQAKGTGRWQQIGSTSQGNPVFIDPKSVKTAHGITSAWIRVTFNKPVKMPKGDVTAARAHAMFDCAKKTLATKENALYLDEKTGALAQRTVNAQPGFGPTIGGSFADVALKYVCR